ncbi:hypothetical protein PUF88_00165 [Lactobacillaceae bacterium L1_55_11]|nr:hypothetical protein [Lactobacillaceae bacterium L1_55_11]
MANFLTFLFLITIGFSIYLWRRNKKRGQVMAKRQKYGITALAVALFLLIGVTAPHHENVNGDKAEQSGSTSEKSTSSSSKKERHSSSSSKSSQSSSDTSSSESSSKASESSQTNTQPASQNNSPATSTAPAPQQPAHDDNATTVYVANNGNSNVYWYNPNLMPARTNRAKVVQMTEAQAKQLGKRLSLRD